MSGFAIMKKPQLSSFVAGQGILASCVVMCFSIKFFLCSFFPDGIAFSSILRNENDLLRVPFYPSRKKSQLASNFKLTRTPTIYGEHGIMAHIL